MRWTLPSIHDCKVVSKFAFFPVTLSDNKTVVWLQRYYVTYYYVNKNPGWANVMKFDANLKPSADFFKNRSKLLDWAGHLPDSYTFQQVDLAKLVNRVVEVSTSYLDRKFYNKVDNIVNE